MSDGITNIGDLRMTDQIAERHFGGQCNMGGTDGLKPVRREAMSEDLKAALGLYADAWWRRGALITGDTVETDAAESAVLALYEQQKAIADQLAEALVDMQSGWQYIRRQHGDLYGVGWERCETSATAALAAYHAAKAVAK